MLDTFNSSHQYFSSNFIGFFFYHDAIIVIVIIIIIMFSVISHRAEILISLVFAVRVDINYMSKVSAISFPGYLTR